jgi:lipopolysaccharide transport system permease protein
MSNLVNGIQFFIFIFFLHVILRLRCAIEMNGIALFFPLLIVMMGVLGLIGMFISQAVTNTEILVI